MVDEKPNPVTPYGRYFVVRGRLRRMTDPSLTADACVNLAKQLMAARRAVGAAKRNEDVRGVQQARALVDKVKRQLGERGLVWWTDGAPDLNRRMVRSTPYAEWFTRLG